MKKCISIIFPNQLLKSGPIIEQNTDVYLIEEYLFFKQYKFHKQKIAFHRASMKSYQQYLETIGKNVIYIDSQNKLSDIRNFSIEIEKKSIDKVYIIDPSDDWLTKRLLLAVNKCDIKIFESQQFLNSKKDLSEFFRSEKKSFFQTTFYKQQRKKWNILLDKDKNPVGGKWTFDSDNRKKYPKDKRPPVIEFPNNNSYWQEAIKYTKRYFGSNYGEVTAQRLYPINHDEAQDWLRQFFKYRFNEFGIYEDAIVKDEIFLNHSILSPLMNIGLILPDDIITQSLSYASSNNIPINSTEGFIRQIIGWREFIRGMYECKGAYSRTLNFWNFKRKIPESFYTGTTGIIPIDQTIKKVLKTGYCHHIERLMVLGNFMLLCEFDPNEVYQWFMELFIDAYDWVMVPNVYGMCLFADGGTFATKPYIGGANYIKKMSNYPKGEWEDIWNGLFWRFILKHKDFFKSNHRTSMLAYSINKMSKEKLDVHIKNAEIFISNKL